MNKENTLAADDSPEHTGTGHEYRWSPLADAPRVSRITVGRLYNLGNYEHVRYELTVDVPVGASAASAIRGIEKILAGLKPLKNACIDTESELARKAREIEEMRKMPVAEWERRYGHCTGTPSEVIARYEESYREAQTKRDAALHVAKSARELFDDLGGAENLADAKTDWDHGSDG